MATANFGVRGTPIFARYRLGGFARPPAFWVAARIGSRIRVLLVELTFSIRFSHSNRPEREKIDETLGGSGGR